MNLPRDEHGYLIVNKTKEQLDAMEELGVDYIQGYYFSKTIPEEEFIELINNNNNN